MQCERCNNCPAHYLCPDCLSEVCVDCVDRCASCSDIICLECTYPGASCMVCRDLGFDTGGDAYGSASSQEPACPCDACVFLAKQKASRVVSDSPPPASPPVGEVPWLSLSVERVKVGEWTTVARLQNGAAVWFCNSPNQYVAEAALLDFLTSHAATLIQEAA